jgi:hypothetical protein
MKISFHKNNLAKKKYYFKNHLSLKKINSILNEKVFYLIIIFIFVKV